MPKLLDFRCAVITGGGGGIGKATARHLVSKGQDGPPRRPHRVQSTIGGPRRRRRGLLPRRRGKDGRHVALCRPHHPRAPRARLPDQQRRRPAGPWISSRTATLLPRPTRKSTSNVRGPMHLTLGAAAAPADQARRRDYQRVEHSGPCALFPSSTPVYNGTKAWLHFWSMNLRTQLRRAGSGVARGRDCAAHGGDGPAPREGGPRR